MLTFASSIAQTLEKSAGKGFINIQKIAVIDYRRLVNTVGKAPVCSAGGQGLIPGRTFTQGLKIIEEKVLPLL